MCGASAPSAKKITEDVVEKILKRATVEISPLTVTSETTKAAGGATPPGTGRPRSDAGGER